jgi:phosphatidylinositol alpha-1,6-mannosyltransferase
MRLGDLQTAYVFYDKGCAGRMCYRILHAIEKFTWRRIDKIIAISESFRLFLVKEGITASKIAVVEESIDADRFYKEADGDVIREKYGIGSRPLAMFHGLVAGIKGLDILLAAIPDTLRVFPDLKLMIVGDGPDLARLKRLAAQLSISRSVIFTGWVPFKDIPSYIAACDAGVPIRSTNLGNNFVVTTAYLQYALLKKPVAVPDLACFKDIAKDNPQLKMFSLKNPATLSEALIYLLRNKKEAAESAQINYKIAVEKFNARDIAAKLASKLDIRRS